VEKAIVQMPYDKSRTSMNDLVFCISCYGHNFYVHE